MKLNESIEFNSIIEKAKNNPNTIALILFGSYATNKQKPNSDIDIAIIRKKNTLPHQFEELKFQDENYDIVFFDKLPDIIKFNCISQGKILVINDSKKFKQIRRTFLHAFRDNYPFYEKNMRKMLNE